MPLSPIDVEQKTFRVALRGYAEDEVDQFLDELVVTLREYERQLRDANERVAALEDQLEANRETEDRIKKTLVIAQRTSDEVVQEARREAQQILADARNRASELEIERVRERESLVADLDLLRVAVADLKDKFTSLSERTLVDLGVIEEEIAGASPVANEPSDEQDYGERMVAESSGDASYERAEESEQPEGQAFLGSFRRPWERDAD